MGHLNSISPASRSDSDPGSEAEFEWPFGRIDYLRRSDLRETAYEVFFMSCRSSPGFGSRNAMTYPFSAMGEGDDGRREGPGSPGAKAGGTMMVVNSKIKKALGLKSRRSSMMRLMNQTGATAHSGTSSPGRGVTSPGRVKRPMTSAEIMRQQMRVTELSDNRLRKTLMRTLVGQVQSIHSQLSSTSNRSPHDRRSKGQLGGELIEHDGGLKDSAVLGGAVHELAFSRLRRDPTDKELGLDPSPSLWFSLLAQSVRRSGGELREKLRLFLFSSLLEL